MPSQLLVSWRCRRRVRKSPDDFWGLGRRCDVGWAWMKIPGRSCFRNAYPWTNEIDGICLASGSLSSPRFRLRDLISPTRSAAGFPLHGANSIRSSMSSALLLGLGGVGGPDAEDLNIMSEALRSGTLLTGSSSPALSGVGSRCGGSGVSFSSLRSPPLS